jgi:hypothetical protein
MKITIEKYLKILIVALPYSCFNHGSRYACLVLQLLCWFDLKQISTLFAKADTAGYGNEEVAVITKLI